MKLPVRITLLVISLALLFGISIILIVNSLLRERLNSAQDEWVSTLVQAIANSIALDTINNDVVHAHERLQIIVEGDDSLSYVYVIDFNGKLFSHSFDQGFPRHLLPQHDDVLTQARPQTLIHTTEGDVLDIVHPLIDGMSAHLHVGVNQTMINALIRRTETDIAIAVLLVALLGTVFALVFSQRISAPLNHLADWIRAYGKGKESTVPYLGKAGPEVTELAATFKSMTEDRRQLEIALKDSEEHYRRLVESTTAIPWQLDLSSQRFVYVGPQAEELLGYPIDDWYTESFWVDHMHADDRERAISFCQQAMAQGEDHDFEYRMLTADTRTLWLRIYVKIQFKGSQPSQLSGFMFDITAHKQAEEKLRKSEAQLAEAQSIAHLGSWKLDLVKNELICSDEIFRIFEVDPAEFGAAYESFLEAVHPKDREWVHQTYMRSIDNQTLVDLEHRALMTDGRIKYLHVQGKTYYDPHGKPLRSIGTVQDITAHKQTQEAIKNIATGVSAQIGQAFFQHLVLHLAKLFEAEHVFIGLLDQNQPDVVNTYSMCSYGQISDNKPYSITDTPCAQVIARGTCAYPEHVQQLFPNDHMLAARGIESYIGTPLLDSRRKPMGLLVALRKAPMQNIEQVGETLHIFASRAAAEFERLSTEQQLRNTKQKLSLHVQQTPLGVIEWDTDLRVRDWNPAAERIFGYSKEQALGQHAKDLIIPPTVVSQIDKVWDDLLKQKGGTRNTNENITKDGKIIMCEWYNTPLIAENNQVIGVASLVADVTQRLRDQEELIKHRDRLEELVAARTTEVCEQARIIDQIHDSVVSTDLDGIITDWNNGAEHLYGYSPEEAIGQHIAFLYPEEERSTLQEAINSLQQHDEYEYEVRLRKKNGQDLFVHLSLSMLYHENGKPRGMIGYSIDITDRKRAQEEIDIQKYKLEATNKELEAFSYSVSHDLRAPLRALHGFSQALQEDYADNLDEEGKDYLIRIQANALRMSELIDDLLKLSRLGREKLTVTLVDLSHLAHEVMDVQRSNYPDRSIEFQLQFNGQVYGDSRLLRIAIENLISNALKYTRNVENPHIEFGKTQQNNETVYYISDNGTGFDMQYADKLFGVFQRLHGSDYEGTGIGLATVKRIIQRHAGRIWAEAEPGKGATFYFTVDNLSPASSE